jgi:hypothetical protein
MREARRSSPFALRFSLFANRCSLSPWAFAVRQPPFANRSSPEVASKAHSTPRLCRSPIAIRFSPFAFRSSLFARRYVSIFGFASSCSQRESPERAAFALAVGPSTPLRAGYSPRAAHLNMVSSRGAAASTSHESMQHTSPALASHLVGGVRILAKSEERMANSGQRLATKLLTNLAGARMIKCPFLVHLPIDIRTPPRLSDEWVEKDKLWLLPCGRGI